MKLKASAIAVCLLVSTVSVFGQNAETVEAKPAPKAPRIEFRTDGQPSVTLDNGKIYINDSRLPAPYDEIIMEATPENMASCLWINMQTQMWELMVKATLIKIERDKAEVQRQLDKFNSKHSNVDPDGPKDATN